MAAALARCVSAADDVAAGPLVARAVSALETAWSAAEDVLRVERDSGLTAQVLAPGDAAPRDGVAAASPGPSSLFARATRVACLGLGRPSRSCEARAQLALTMALAARCPLHVGAPVVVDPAMDADDAALVAARGGVVAAAGSDAAARATGPPPDGGRAATGGRGSTGGGGLGGGGGGRRRRRRRSARAAGRGPRDGAQGGGADPEVRPPRPPSPPRLAPTELCSFTFPTATPLSSTPLWPRGGLPRAPGRRRGRRAGGRPRPPAPHGAPPSWSSATPCAPSASDGVVPRPGADPSPWDPPGPGPTPRGAFCASLTWRGAAGGGGEGFVGGVSSSGPWTGRALSPSPRLTTPPRTHSSWCDRRRRGDGGARWWGGHED